MTKNNDSAGIEGSSPEVNRLANNDVVYTLTDFEEGSRVTVVEARGRYYRVSIGTLEEDLSDHGFILADEEAVADLIENKREAKSRAKDAIVEFHSGGGNDA